MESTPVTAAVVQAAPFLFDTPRTLEKLVDLTSDAARRGANLVVFPEAFVGGYPKGLDFGARLGIRLPEGREDFRRYFESAIAVPGPATEAIGAAASAAAVHLVVGVIERDGGTLYCTALMFGPDGRLLAKHRKLMPTAMERLVWGFGDGSTLAVVDTPLGRLGSVICWENYMPLLRMAMYAKGIQLYCAPTVDDRDTWLPTMRTIALGGALLRHLGLPVSDPGRLSGGLPRHPGRRPGDRPDPGWILHRRALGERPGGAELRWRTDPGRRARSGRYRPRQV